MNNEIIEINKNDLVLARYIPNDALVKGLGFYSEPEDFIQVGSWNYQAGKELLAHNHHKVERTINRTQEVVVILKGKLKATIFDEEDLLVKEIYTKSGDVLVMLNGGHSYEILEDDTLVIEIKNGPYPGAEIDRRRL